METPRNERQEKQDAERLRQENVVKAIKLIERNPEFSDVLVQIHDRNQALEAQMPTEAKERLSEARLTYLLKWVEIFGEAHLRVVTDLESVESLTTIMEHFVRATWLKFSGIPMEEIRPSPQFAQPHPTQSKRDKLLKAAQHWVMEWHRRLASLRKDRPEVMTEEQPSTRRKILEPNLDSLANPDVTKAKAVSDSDRGSSPDSGPVGEPGTRVRPSPMNVPASETPPPLVAVPVEATAENRLFRKSGAYWELRFGGKPVLVRDSKGMKYIVELLRCPGTDIHVSQLLGAVEGQGEELRLGSAGIILDETARRQYKARGEELTEELEEAKRNNNWGRQEEIETELDQMAEQLASATGLGGRDREACDDVERARKRVSRAITTAIKAIGEHHRELADHVSLHVKRGEFCCYHGDGVDWQL